MQVQLSNEIFETSKFCAYYDVIDDLIIYYNKAKTPIQDESYFYYELKFEKISEFSYYNFGWGNEFEKRDTNCVEGFSLKNENGRSSKIGTFFEVNNLTKIAIAYSGNFRLDICNDTIKIQIEPGIETTRAQKISPFILVGNESDSFYKYIKKTAPSNEFLSSMPVEYNHWWAYEDVLINEEKFLADCKVAKEIGIDFALLDAGWFGKDGKNWFDIRGDWEIENEIKFPNGISALANNVRKLGLEFGIWIEPEGLGKNADICVQKPEIVAKRNGENLGYVCLGSNEGYLFAKKIFEDIIEKTKCRWIKIDFNLDPGLGCNDNSHNHGEKDGLYQHYMNLYKLLSEINAKYPDVVLENCSSGGQRLDFGMFSHTHCSFMSDPDYIEHHDNCYRELVKFFPPSNILHWVWSETYNQDIEKRPFPSIGINEKEIPVEELQYYLRKTFVHNFGFSHQLHKYNIKTKEIIKTEISNFKEIYSEYIKENNITMHKNEDIETIIFKKDSKKLVFVFDNLEKKSTINVERI